MPLRPPSGVPAPTRLADLAEGRRGRRHVDCVRGSERWSDVQRLAVICDWQLLRDWSLNVLFYQMNLIIKWL